MEILIIIISVIIYYVFRIINLEIILIYYLIFSVCERVLGLMILILLIRYNGNEIYYSMNLFIFFYDKIYFYINIYIFYIYNKLFMFFS